MKPDHGLPSVLIVDSSDDSLEVLETALRRRNVATFATSDPEAGLESVRRQGPEVVVLDLDSFDSYDPDLGQQFALAARIRKSSLILLGNRQMPRAGGPNEHLVTKPYHYGELVRRIEGLLTASSASSKAA